MTEEWSEAMIPIWGPPKPASDLSPSALAKDDRRRCHFCKNAGEPCKYCFGTGWLEGLHPRKKQVKP